MLKTEGNFNNEIGLRSLFLRFAQNTKSRYWKWEFPILERCTVWRAMARPDIGVITNIGLCHLENLGTRDGILQAKTEMFDHLQVDGTVILNGDDDKLSTKKRGKRKNR